MQVRIDEPEPQVVLRLRHVGSGEVRLTAKIAGSDDEQDLLAIFAGGKPTQHDPLGQRNERLLIETLKVRDSFPTKLNGHGHVEIGFRA